MYIKLDDTSRSAVAHHDDVDDATTECSKSTATTHETSKSSLPRIDGTRKRIGSTPNRCVKNQGQDKTFGIASLSPMSPIRIRVTVPFKRLKLGINISIGK